MGNSHTISEQVEILPIAHILLTRRDEEHVACLSPKGKMKPGRRTVEVLSTPVKETLTMEVAGNLVKEVMEESSIPLSPIKMVSSKNSR